MAPKGGKDAEKVHQIDRTPEYEEFIKKVATFHEKRGTTFEPEPRLPVSGGHVNVDLLKLYNGVIERGGYDELCSKQKAWAQLATDLGMFADDNKNMGQLSFQLKSDFYRYLGAYWIQDQYQKEPPPKEILEAVSCATKFGPILTRTIESYELATGKRPGSETPVKEDKPAESTPVSGNRASGRLREAPAQRIPFQPETGSTRAPRQTPSQQHNVSQPHHAANSHTPSHGQQHHQHHAPQRFDHPHMTQPPPPPMRGASGAYIPPNSETASRLSEIIEPRGPINVPLRPVHTPGNNPVEYARRQRQLRLAAAGMPEPVPGRAPVPGANNDGPNIYARCLQSLRSGIPSEQAFALHHLVKISFERGDKFKFESFLGLAEGLIEKGLEIASLFYHVELELDYTGADNGSNSAVLDGVNGTRDILSRIQKFKRRATFDHLQSGELADNLVRITEAVLTIRNMVMLQENAIYMGQVYPLKDLLCIILELPRLELLVEVKHFALDIAEQLTPWVILDSEDPLYQSLLGQLDSTDRGTILTALRAISRISMNLEDTNKLQKVPAAVLQNIITWLFLNDEELMDACLDFLYQYTAVVPNVESLLGAVDMEQAIPHLVRLLAHGSRRMRESYVLEPERKVGATEHVVPLPQDLQDRLTGTEEPQRCFNWLTSLFEEDADSNITQIAIWQAYQSSFGGKSRNTLSAADFIRNVSHVFVNARAQIIRGPGEAQRFIIEGIRARTVPLDYETKEEYARCQWVMTGAQRCGGFFPGGEKLWQHIVGHHLEQTPGEDKKFADTELEKGSCKWGDCKKYAQPTKMQLSQLTRHLKTHISTSAKRGLSDGGSDVPAKKLKKSYLVPAKTMTITWEKTLTTPDERNPRIDRAAGIPLSAVLVLRNIARNVVKTESQETLLQDVETGGEVGGWNERLFRPVLSRLFEVMTENPAMSDYIASLLQLVQQDV
ncbi:Chromatin structure-remodeling complex protein rsc9 [Pestalotiopsis sp. 9143b]|nr:Chromatin structure-remodeling complex protein rsc9 [Pestalotiopsis sp. 9143b]